MSVISSYEAQFSATGVQETKNGFAEIAKAAALADRQARVNSQNLKDYAKTQIQTEREKARAAETAAKAQAKAAAQSDAMWKKVGAGAAVAAAAVVKFGLDSYKAYQQYAGAVRDVALASGASAEQSSLFLQVLDDFEISAGDVTKAMRAMTKNGMTPTIDTLAQLADKYVAIEDPMKRNEFLMKNLGKAGLEWANALSQGGDALRASSEEVNKNLVLTDEQIKKAEMARLAVDAWADAWEGFKIAVGGAVGNMIVANQETQDMATRFHEVTGLVAQKAPEAFEKFKAAMDRAAASEAHIARDDTVANIDELKASAEDAAKALADLSSANAKLINDAISIQSYNDRYNESQTEILDTIKKLQAEKDAMNASETEAIADINEKIDEQKEKYAEGAEAFGAAQGEKLTMLALEKIALQDGVAGYSEAEAEKARLLLDTAGIAEDSAFRQALAFDTASAAIANGTMKAGELKKILDLMSKKGYTIDVAINLSNNLTMASMAASGGGSLLAGNAASTGNPLGNSQTQAMNNWRGGIVGSYATGGAGGGWGIVGDKQGGGWVDGVSELVFGNFKVFPSRQAKNMLQSGMLGKVPGFAFGTEDGGYTSGGAVKIPYIPTPTTPTRTKGNGGSFDGASPVSMSSAVQAIETQAVEMQSTTQAVVQQLVSQFNTMTNQLIASNQESVNALGSIANILLTSNPKAVGSAVAYEVSKNS